MLAWLAEQAATLYACGERVLELALALDGRQEVPRTVREWQVQISPETRSLFSRAWRTPFSSLLVRLAPGEVRDRDLAKCPGR